MNLATIRSFPLRSHTGIRRSETALCRSLALHRWSSKLRPRSSLGSLELGCSKNDSEQCNCAHLEWLSVARASVEMRRRLSSASRGKERGIRWKRRIWPPLHLCAPGVHLKGGGSVSDCINLCVGKCVLCLRRLPAGKSRRGDVREKSITADAPISLHPRPRSFFLNFASTQSDFLNWHCFPTFPGSFPYVPKCELQ